MAHLQVRLAKIVSMSLAAMALVSVVAVVLLRLSETAGTLADKNLKMVHVIMRHGVRTPADTYPTDPYINNSFYPIGWGQLTNRGKLQCYDIGQYLRERYDWFLGDRYWSNRYYSQSTDVDRTMASIQLVNAGLWPPKGPQKWGPLSWQPVPVHAEPLGEDMLLLVRKPCAAYHKERDKVLASDEQVQKMFDDYRFLFEALTFYTGRTVENFDDVQDVFSTLRAEESYDLALPEWTSEFYPDVLAEATAFSYVLNAWNDRMNRLKGGVLFKKILEDWLSVENETDHRRAYLYGGHDSTIVNLMRTLKVWDTQMPDYGITVLLELSQDESGLYGVEIYLRNSTENPAVQLTIPGCAPLCPLNRLVELTESVVPQNWEEECENDGSYDVPEPGGP